MTWGWEHNEGLPTGALDVPAGTTTVELTFSRIDEGTLLRLRHNLPTEAARAFHLMGFELALDRLVIVASGGHAGPNPLAEF